jgi:hypothetical protein
MTRTAAVALSEAPSRTFAGNENFHRALCDLLDGAQSEVADYVVPETRPDEHDQFILKAYGNAARRGVRCRNLIAPQHLHIVQSTWDPDFNMREFLQKVPHIRLVDKVHGPFTVVDRRYVFLNVNTPRRSSWTTRGWPRTFWPASTSSGRRPTASRSACSPLGSSRRVRQSPTRTRADSQIASERASAVR